ncbi:MAG: NAD(P)H-dependent oxidoreductase subunit E [Cyclobacteriaceae bacterium]|nr:NADP oxidoreductase [Cytophagales bacterium]HNP78091.1 NAD(P)H-dependent oxidoreductase subunit E [Cyclobacteriaceae bacterium]
MQHHPDFFPLEPRPSRLLNELWKAQDKDRHISTATIEKLAVEHNLSEIEVQGVASFYHFFHERPAGTFTIYVDNSIIAEFKGYVRIKEAFERETGASLGSVDRTGTFGLFQTPCIGLSDQQPAALINFCPFTNLNSQKIKEIIQKLRHGARPEDICDKVDEPIRYLPENNRTVFFAPYVPGAAIAKLKAMNPEAIIEHLRISELSGRGGAFYPTSLKWDACRKQCNPVKFVVCNADEGEPGTFKDRSLLDLQTGSVLEGMILAGFTVGASYGVIYLRAEYRWLEEKILQTIKHFRDIGLLGKDITGIHGFDFDIRLQRGAGAYVCGEETALLESMEGKRGEPRTKWFFPVEKGYLNYPTVVNNVETFAAVTRILTLGLNDYLQRGLPGSPGTKIISVSGDCRKPGIYEIEWGMTVDQILTLCEAEDPYYIQFSGPSGECISIKEKHRRFSMLDLLSQKDIRCGGSLMIFNKDRDLIQVLMNFAAFFKHESCGICTPCRAGNFIIQRKLERLQHKLADADDLRDLTEWGHIMKATSRCGLGKTATNSLTMALDKFQDYFKDRFASGPESNTRKFDMEAALAEYEKYKP